MLRTLTVAALLAAAATAAPAAAAEFSGFRAEVQGGWDNPVINYSVFSADDVYWGTYHKSHSGFMYGAEVGYDFPVSDTIILGVLASVDGTTVKLNAEHPTISAVSANVGVQWDIAARAGFKVADSTLLYASAGYANTQVKYYYTDILPPLSADLEVSRRYGGFLLAAGVEQAFGEKFYGKLEYRYSNYQAGVTRNQIVAGAGIRF
jgi:outer membrane immunogenic protein